MYMVLPLHFLFQIKTGDLGPLYKIRVGQKEGHEWEAWHLEEVRNITIFWALLQAEHNHHYVISVIVNKANIVIENIVNML